MTPDDMHATEPDDRETLTRVVHENRPRVMTWSEARRIADAVLAAGFRRAPTVPDARELAAWARYRRENAHVLRQTPDFETGYAAAMEDLGVWLERDAALRLAAPEDGGVV